MKYKINSLKELNSELIKTLNENDVIEIVNEEINIENEMNFKSLNSNQLIRILLSNNVKVINKDYLITKEKGRLVDYIKVENKKEKDESIMQVLKW